MKIDTNQAIRKYIDKRNKRINEGICPILNAIDCTEKERRKLQAEKNRLEKEIKAKDPEYYNEIIKLDK